ncbi:hypothetical protein SDC9_182520 [bioreactor metagenome]|uniref:Secretion system C-terminal sorting domain-containing protein n=1 Tax=bioreactor metagenome TaxID=1076179 RepID=A0A645H931_9ZZZZ
MFAIGAVSVEEPTMITGNAIASVSPNPVSDDATIKINLTENANVNIAIYDLHGAKIIDIVNNDVIAAGTHNIDFNASNLSSGVYVIRMQVNGTILVKEFVKVK